MEAQHRLSADVAGECMVLLKNEGGLLPLSKDAKVAFIGEFADKPRFQGGGSSHINCFKVTSALAAAKEAGLKVTYAPGYRISQDGPAADLIAEAVAAAKAADVAVVFAGLPDRFESEGYDRTHMRMPEGQDALIAAVAAANPKTVVVLHNGSPVEMPWIGQVPAVLEAYLGGQAVGLATIRVLTGEVNPSGHLAETFPLRLQDNPSYLFFGGEPAGTDYREGIFVGYRYYDKKDTDVLFPFGHGLSYTTFAFENLALSADAISDTDSLKVSFTVRNTGNRAGKAVPQLYVGALGGDTLRPVRELKGFAKVALAPGESKEVSLTLDKRSFAVWNTEIHDWFVESGEYGIWVGDSSRSLPLYGTVNVASTTRLPRHYTMDTIFMDLAKDPEAMKVFGPLLAHSTDAIKHDEDTGTTAASEAITDEMSLAMMQYMPLRGAASFSGNEEAYKAIEAALKQLND